MILRDFLLDKAGAFRGFVGRIEMILLVSVGSMKVETLLYFASFSIR